MTRTECERLVEEYLDGGMSTAKEQEFFIQVALDNELRRTLKAYSIVEKAIRMEREAEVVSHAAARRAVAAGLLPSLDPEIKAATKERRRRGASAFGGLLLLLLLVTGFWFFGRGEQSAFLSPGDQLPAPTPQIEEPTSITRDEVNPSEPTLGEKAEGVHRSEIAAQPAEPPGATPERGTRPQHAVPAEEVDPTLIPDVESETASGQMKSAEDSAPDEESAPLVPEPTVQVDSTAGRFSDRDDPQLPIEIDWGGSDE